MNRRQLAIIFAIVAVVLAGVIILLVTGGNPPSSGESAVAASDAGGDVQVGVGADPPTDLALADIAEAHVRREGEGYVFTARLGAEIPRRLRGTALDLRWDINSGGESLFLLTANLDVGPNASLIAQDDSSYGSSTIDQSFPGDLAIDGDTLTITLLPADLGEGAPEFPEEFTWILSTALDGKRGDPTSALAQDRAPDSGEGSIEG